MKFAIKHSNGTTFYEGKPKYNGIFGKPSYLEFSEIASDKPISFAIGDYVDYSRTGFRYKLYSIPQVDKSATKQTYGGAFVYKNVQFYCVTKDLEIALFRDLVMYDNTIHFSSLAEVSTYENVYGIVDRIQANMDNAYGSGVWNITVVNTNDAELNALLNEVRQFSISDATCLDALNEIYNIWKGIGWVYSVVSGVHTITLGKPNIQSGDNTTDIFAYGHDNGLKVIAKAESSKNEFATRVYAYGSDRNMPTRYYNNLSTSIKDKQSIYIPHLMLPLSDWGTTSGQKDASKAYLQSPLASSLGVIPKILRFDGSGDYPEIYPSIEGMTAGDAGVTGIASSTRLDAIKSVTNPTDNGMYTEDSEKVIGKTTTSVDATTETGTINPTQTSATFSFGHILSLTGFSKIGKCTITPNGIKGTLSGISEYVKGTPKLKVSVCVGGDEVFVKDVETRWGDDALGFTLPEISFNCKADNADIDVYLRIESEIAFITKISVLSVTYTCSLTAGTLVTSLEYSLQSTFSLVVHDLGFDIADMGNILTNGLGTISFKDGMCAGREFQINSCEHDATNHQYKLVCQRQEDTSLSQWFPNSIYHITAGDHFVLTDIQMPEVYVTAAMTRLHNAANQALTRLSKPKMTYVPTVDSKAVYVSDITLLEGMYMPIYDSDLIGTEISGISNTTWVLIDSMTIAENEDAIPIWSVTLRDEKAESMIQKITGDVTRGNRFIKDLQDEDTRRPVGDGLGDGDPNASPKVYIERQTEFFVYDEKKQLISEPSILLTAVTEGINDPTFQWYFLGEGDWEAITDATEQSYAVLADSDIYFLNDQLVEDFKVEVNGTYSSQLRIIKVRSGDGYMIQLNNPVHIFPSEDGHAVESSDTVTVIAYRGMTPVDVTIGTITGDGDGIPEGMTVSTGGEEFARTITIEVDEDLVQQGGKLLIPVTVVPDTPEPEPEEDSEEEEGDEPEPETMTVTLTYSWALASAGAKGDPGEDGDDGYSSATIYLYKRSRSTITQAPGNLTYDFTDGSMTGTFNGWSTSIDPDTSNGPVFVIKAYVTSQADTETITGGWLSAGGSWTSPARLTGDNGAIGKIMRGVNEWSSSFTPTGGWQGINDSESSHIFYDVVKYNGKYYYLTNSEGGSQNPATSSFWVEATNFDFIATKVLLADKGFIDVLSSNGIYMKDTASDGIVAGMVGGLTDVNDNPVVNFFAGATNGNVESSAFKVYSDGKIVATKGEFGNLRIVDGRVVADTTSGSDYRRIDVNPNIFSVYGYNNSEEEGLWITPLWSHTSYDVPAPIYAKGYSVFDGNMTINGELEVTGIKIYPDPDLHYYENVVTSPDGALHIDIVTSYPATLADNTIYIKVQ